MTQPAITIVVRGTPAPPAVLGLDLSLTATGLAGPDWTRTLKPPGRMVGVDRLDWILDRVVEHLDGVALAVVEGPSYGSVGRGQHERGGLWWLIARLLAHRQVPTAVVSPNARAKYATGKGNAGKADVIREVARRFDWFEGDDNAADALILAAMGADHLGQPMTTMPATHRAALTAVTWPTITETTVEAP
ncbi:MAG TPA: hypothetical protein VGM93_00010 [Acidimicrobiales bacterium]|jgi:crossover junction endodeoxyribonuclease RuvC